MDVTRREFLNLAWLITTVWGALSNFVKYRLLGLPLPAQGESIVSHEPERWAPSVCQLCPAGCGVVARIIDGRVVKIEGLPAHPVNQGSLCPKGFAGVTELYHPDRLLHVNNREWHENRQRDDLLQDFQLRQGHFLVTDPVGRHLQDILEESDAPTRVNKNASRTKSDRRLFIPEQRLHLVCSGKRESQLLEVSHHRSKLSYHH